jgi:DNA-binding transcriptional regulator YiaG
MAIDSPESLIRELKEWRRRHKISQVELANLIGVKKQNLNDWFIKGRKPSLAHGLLIQKFLRENK